MKELLSNYTGFDWDDGNSEKNWNLHHVNCNECEQVFFNEPLVVSADKKHSQLEKRWYLLGSTDSQRLLFVVFTIRENLIRVISARDMNKKERKIYYEQV
jgi:uncharacterized DUF497 family protein